MFRRILATCIGLRIKMWSLDLATLADFECISFLVLLDEAFRRLDLLRSLNSILLIVLLQFEFASISTKSHEGLLFILLLSCAVVNIIFIIKYFELLIAQVRHIIELLEYFWGLKVRSEVALALERWVLLLHGIGAAIILLLRWFASLVDLLIIVACRPIARISRSLRSGSLTITSQLIDKISTV